MMLYRFVFTRMVSIYLKAISGGLMVEVKKVETPVPQIYNDCQARNATKTKRKVQIGQKCLGF